MKRPALGGTHHTGRKSDQDPVTRDRLTQPASLTEVWFE